VSTTDPTALSPARQHFISAWPDVMKPWSLPKAAAKIHALLLSSPAPMTADDIADTLELSSGSASTQLRLLNDLGMIERLRIMGIRKSHYKAISDPAHIFVALAEARKRQAFKAMDTMAPVVTSIAQKEDVQWLNTVWQLQALSDLMSQWLQVCTTKDPEWTVRLMQSAISQKQ
jgi:DNA-binding transcriptional regulator GbsR (MarR family)